MELLKKGVMSLFETDVASDLRWKEGAMRFLETENIADDLRWKEGAVMLLLKEDTDVSIGSGDSVRRLAVAAVETVHSVVSPYSYVVKKISDRAANGVAVAIVESSREITAMVLRWFEWGIVVCVVAVVSMMTARAFVVHVLGRRSSMHDTDIRDKDEFDLTLVNEMLLMHEILEVAKTTKYDNRKGAIEFVLDCHDVDKGRLDELYALVRTKDDIVKLEASLTPVEQAIVYVE